MPLKNVLPLDPVVNIIVNLSTVSATRKKFNLALLMGDVGTVADFNDRRIVTYDSLTSMLQGRIASTRRLRLSSGSARSRRSSLLERSQTRKRRSRRFRHVVRRIRSGTLVSTAVT